MDEMQEVTLIVRRIAAILLLSPALDANFAAVRAEARPVALADEKSPPSGRPNRRPR